MFRFLLLILVNFLIFIKTCDAKDYYFYRTMDILSQGELEYAKTLQNNPHRDGYLFGNVDNFIKNSDPIYFKFPTFDYVLYKNSKILWKDSPNSKLYFDEPAMVFKAKRLKKKNFLLLLEYDRYEDLISLGLAEDKGIKYERILPTTKISVSLDIQGYNNVMIRENGISVNEIMIKYMLSKKISSKFIDKQLKDVKEAHNHFFETQIKSLDITPLTPLGILDNCFYLYAIVKKKLENQKVFLVPQLLAQCSIKGIPFFISETRHIEFGDERIKANIYFKNMLINVSKYVKNII